MMFGLVLFILRAKRCIAARREVAPVCLLSRWLWSMRLLARWTTLTLVLTNCATAAGTKTNANYCVIRPAGREMNVDSRKAGVQGNPTPTRHFTGGGIKSEHTYMSCHTCLFCQISENKNFRKFCAEFWRFFKNLRCFSFPLSSFAKFREKKGIKSM